MPGPYIQSWKKVSTIAKHIQTQSEWEQTMARRVMEQLRGLYLDQRYLTAALGALPAALQESGGSFATDGGALYYPHRMAAGHLPQEPAVSAPGLPAQPVPLHLPASLAAGQARPDLWGLACDIAVEATLDTLNTPATKRPVGWVRQQCYHSCARSANF